MTARYNKRSDGAPTRRQFLRACAAGAAAAGSAGAAARVPAMFGLAPAGAPEKSKVVVARDARLRGAGSNLDSDRLLKLLDRAVQAFYGSDSAAQAWQRIARPQECVGLKVNGLAGRGASTSVKLVEAVTGRLQEAGIRNIVIWDRLTGDLESAGFRLRSKEPGVRYIGNDAAGYEDELAVYGSVGSLVSKTLTRTCDAVINLPVLKDHSIAGVTIALKNFFGAIHNPNKYHLNAGDPYVADVNMLPPIRQKVRLTICDATAVQYEGGPSFLPQWSWRFNGVLVARDAVALDSVGWQIIEQKRAEQGMKSLEALGRAPKYIATAAGARHRLGTDNPKQIERLEI